MPQADLSYTADLDFDAAKALAVIEETIKSRDETAGNCKGRAHAVQTTHHDHVLLRVAVLEKPHRDEAFMNAMTQSLIEALKPLIPAGTPYNVLITFLSPYHQAATA